MEDFAEAVVGTPGEGLNVEQRKLWTISVELAAKPALLLFLDEPTSGLDSQSAWSICVFLRKLADNGQAVLSTIHQPSAILFQEFDRLLFLAKGGKTVYFGEIGKQSRTLLDYFERNGARKCEASENVSLGVCEYCDKCALADILHTTSLLNTCWKSSPLALPAKMLRTGQWSGGPVKRRRTSRKSYSVSTKKEESPQLTIERIIVMKRIFNLPCHSSIRCGV